MSDVLRQIDDEVSRRDYERYLCGHLAPAALRPGFHAVLAFNIELAAAQRLQEPLLGEIRLQWWRDCLAATPDGGPAAGHPLATALAGLMAEDRLSFQRLSALIEGRAAELDSQPPADLPALLARADATAGNLNGLLLELLGCDGDLPAGRAVARAWALLGVLRNLPFEAAERRSRLAPAAKALCEEARRCLSEARSLRSGTPRAALPVLMCGVLAEGYARRLARAGFDPFALDLRRPAAWDLTRFYVRAKLGRY